MEPGRGLVLEVNKRSCIIITGDGQFLEVPKPRGGAEVGKEITLSRTFSLRFKWPYMAVASLLVAVLAWWAFYAMFPRAMAYVSLDINPSLELAINDNSEIILARGVNKDGRKLLQQVDVLHEPLAKGVQKIITGCIEYHYIKQDKDNLILATVTDAKRRKSNTDKQENQEIKQVYNYVYTSINNTINESGVGAELIIADTDLVTLEKAHDTGVTPGRYILQKEAQKNGVEITDQELREERIRELEKKKNFRAGELIQQRMQTDLSDKQVYTNNSNKNRGSVKTNKSELYVNIKQTEHQNHLDKPNWSLALSRGAVNVNKYQRESEPKNNSVFYARGNLYIPRDNGYLTGITVYSQLKHLTNSNNGAGNNLNYYNQSYFQDKQVVSRSSNYSQRITGEQQNKQLQNTDSANQSVNKNSLTNNLGKQSSTKVKGPVVEKITHNQQNKRLQNADSANQSANKNNFTSSIDQQSGVGVNDSVAEKTRVNQGFKQLQNTGSANKSANRNNLTRTIEQQSGVGVNGSVAEKTRVNQGFKQLQNTGSANKSANRNNLTRTIEQQSGVGVNGSVAEKTRVNQGFKQLHNTGGADQSANRNNLTRTIEQQSSVGVNGSVMERTKVNQPNLQVPNHNSGKINSTKTNRQTNTSSEQSAIRYHDYLLQRSKQ
ncbi:Anti-sigma-I factor RsgI [Sporotomaculum syntrophicum]|uniref:Anti-sigma-I factor RsgI n=1 Tax=Sporotomaculum syntrophicum TaxID=182264 RepID=A0A9D2WPG6_9FIRM|nr:anti-sigma factor domain-containing protein [Sporotomaculum syntrophicum]KAF1084531.1 Anti-sigma-I factor RsgI [Sporotomaculum syntrophicum]